MSDELEVPDAAIIAVTVDEPVDQGDEALFAWVRAIATPVVAAELRRLAEDMWCMNGHELVLQARADELDGDDA